MYFKDISKDEFESFEQGKYLWTTRSTYSKRLLIPVCYGL